MDMIKVLNYLNTASPEQVDEVRKHIGLKKQAKIIHSEYQNALEILRNDYRTAQRRLQDSLENLEREIKARDEHYRVRAASMGLHWDEVIKLATPAKPRPSLKGIRKWRVVTPIKQDTRTFKTVLAANAYRKKMGGYLYNTQTERTYLLPLNSASLPM